LASQTFPGTAAANPIGTRQSEVQPGCYADKRLIAAAYADDTLDAGFIRLVRITQDATTGGVECRTEHFSLEHPPPYTALSYACGPRPADFNMKLNGRDWSVRQNLSHFLRQHLQMDRDPQEWLWIDAICINQANLSERTHQVRLMADIYGKASRVIVWLGAACEDSDAAMRGLLTSRCPVGLGPGRSLLKTILAPTLGTSRAQACKSKGPHVWLQSDTLAAL
jgi:hypothetical protein